MSAVGHRITSHPKVFRKWSRERVLVRLLLLAISHHNAGVCSSSSYASRVTLTWPLQSKAAGVIVTRTSPVSFGGDVYRAFGRLDLVKSSNPL